MTVNTMTQTCGVLSLLVFAVFGMAYGTMDLGNCRSMLRSCSLEPGCRKGLEGYYLHCVENAYGTESQCGFDCRKALSTLLYAPNSTGEDFLTCNCSADTRCIERQNKVSTCFAEVQLALGGLESENPTDLGCSTVYALCSANEKCQAKWREVLKQCPAMLLGRTCNRDCREAISDLYSLSTGRGFESCQCDGNGDHEFTNFNCIRYRKNQEPLCSKPLPPEVTTVASVPVPVDDVSVLVANNSSKSGKYDIVGNEERKNSTQNKNNEKSSADIVVSAAHTLVAKGNRELWINVSMLILCWLGLRYC